jgi:integral membrane sensor domain MASE1
MTSNSRCCPAGDVRNSTLLWASAGPASAKGETRGSAVLGVFTRSDKRSARVKTGIRASFRVADLMEFGVGRLLRTLATGPSRGSAPLAAKVLLLAIACHFSTEIGFAHKIPPHNISVLWPTTAILFSVLVATPARHWWAYVLAAYFSSIVNDARAGFPVFAVLFVAAGILEIVVAAAGVRRFADGLRAFASLRSLVAYVLVAVIVAPAMSALVAAVAGSGDQYWFYWRVWFLSEGLALLMLAPAILTWIWIASARGAPAVAARGRWMEAGLVGAGLIAVSLQVFAAAPVGESRLLALVYLPLPFLLWAAVRFGPVGENTSLLIVALVAISGTVAGRGPFAARAAVDNVLSLQLFLVTMAVPLMFLATLVEERRQRTRRAGTGHASIVMPFPAVGGTPGRAGSRTVRAPATRLSRVVLRLDSSRGAVVDSPGRARGRGGRCRRSWTRPAYATSCVARA